MILVALCKCEMSFLSPTQTRVERFLWKGLRTGSWEFLGLNILLSPTWLEMPSKRKTELNSIYWDIKDFDIDSYYHNRILRWAGHVARMPMTRAPRQLLTGWVAHSRPSLV